MAVSRLIKIAGGGVVFVVQPMKQDSISRFTDVWRQAAQSAKGRKLVSVIALPGAGRGGDDCVGRFRKRHAMRSGLFAMLLLAGCSGQLVAGRKTQVGVRVPEEKTVAIGNLDHSAFGKLLQRYVDKDGMVDYRRWHQTKADRQALDRYIAELSRANPKAAASREHKLAFWINAYNAVTLHGILKEYPTKSIRNHTSNLGGYNIWHDYQLLVANQPYSLDQIEHQILRKMSEPRIHFAIVCASIGCPRLLSEAYVAEKLEQQLEENARDFFARERNFRYDAKQGTFYLSELLNWFGSDFGNQRAQQLKTYARWLPSESSRKAANANAVKVKYLKYNWDLNEQPNRSK